ncbi:MAG: 30S ribosomal protein S6 [Anaerolineae bacterium]|nr:30S ribosomal protein S6 [Anaerolineae bacterium]
MRRYELVYIVHPQVDQEGLAAVNEEVQNLLESTGGTVHEVKPWGLRRLAYPIQKIWEGHYMLLDVSLQPQSLIEIERRLKLKDQIIRHLIVRTGEE